MFTGLIESLGIVVSISSQPMVLEIQDSVVLSDIHLGDSISVNGVCLTVTWFDHDSFRVGVAPETIRKTNLGDLTIGEKVNLERAMALSARFGGHFVQGHVDNIITIHSISPDPPASLLVVFHVPLYEIDLLTYIVPKGYVTLDGTSLTVIDVDFDARTFSVMLIPYTQSRIILPTKSIGASVNLEVDQMGKYVENVVRGMMASKHSALSQMISSPSS